MPSKKIDIGNSCFYVDTSVNEAFWNSFKTWHWEEWTFSLLKKYLKPGSIFIDAGCWQGPFTLYAASLGATVHAIDADPVCISQLKAHLKYNPLLAEKIHLYKLALTGENKKVQLYERRNFGDSASSLLERTRDSGQSITIEGKTFNSFVSENDIQKADLIKIDIEGGEFFILGQMAETLKKLGYPPVLAAFHATYLKENFMKQSRLLTIISKMNGKLSLLAGKVFANRFAEKKINDVLDNMKDYEMLVENKEKKILNELMHDKMALFVHTE